MMREFPDSCDLAAELSCFTRSMMASGLDEVLECYAKVTNNVSNGRGVLSMIHGRREKDTGVVFRLRVCEVRSTGDDDAMGDDGEDKSSGFVGVELFEDAMQRTATEFVEEATKRALCIRAKLVELKTDVDALIASFGEGAAGPTSSSSSGSIRTPDDSAIGVDPTMFGTAPDFIENIVSFVGNYDLAYRQFVRERQEEEERNRRKSQTRLRAAARAAGVSARHSSPGSSRSFKKDQGYGFPKHEEPTEEEDIDGLRAAMIQIERTEASVICKTVLDELVDIVVAQQ